MLNQSLEIRISMTDRKQKNGFNYMHDEDCTSGLPVGAVVVKVRNDTPSAEEGHPPGSIGEIMGVLEMPESLRPTLPEYLQQEIHAYFVEWGDKSITFCIGS